MYDLIIIGGGPAGITAGIYATRKKIKTLIISKDFIGQVGESGAIENWPGEKSILGAELITKFKEHLDSYGVETREETVVSVGKEENFTVKTEDNLFYSRAVIFASGRKQKLLGIPGEKEFVGKGVVYCATCDAPLFQGKKIIVVGGGNAGFETAIEMKNYTEDVSLFEFNSSFSADEFLQEKAKEKGVKLVNNIKVESVEGEKFVEKVRCRDVVTGEEKDFQVEGLFIQIGSVPITDSVKGLAELNERGDVVIDPRNNQTKTEGLFAAGDVTDVKDKQIVIATGEGAKAALSAYEYLRK